ncbi:hypothetical protein BGZ47_004871 [Haplosporangium gracile]|nr:hypothetical protein BGZ47_004871 [Haplosporangium gracile]
MSPYGVKYHPGMVLDVVYRRQLSTISGSKMNGRSKVEVDIEQVAVREAPDQDADKDDRDENDDYDDGNCEEEERVMRVEEQPQQQKKVEVIEPESAKPRGYQTNSRHFHSRLILYSEREGPEDRVGESDGCEGISNLSEAEWAAIVARAMEMEREEQEQRGKEEG